MNVFTSYKQPDAMDCGPTCLRMVAKHYGKNISLQKLRDKTQIGKEGVNLLGISEAAEAIGFRTQSVKLTYKALTEEAKLPAILHWNQNHFVVAHPKSFPKGRTFERLFKWMQQYVQTAPESGKVLFVTSLQENEYIAKGRSLFYVQPPQTQFYAQLMAGQKGLGKIKAGQKVMLKTESYPPEEYGYLVGSVSHVSGMASRSDSFLVKVELPFGLKTNYGKTLFFRNDLSAQAEIITDNRTLFDRLAGQLKQIWKRQE